LAIVPRMMLPGVPESSNPLLAVGSLLSSFMTVSSSVVMPPVVAGASLAATTPRR